MSEAESVDLPPAAKSGLYKTEICRKFQETGFCRYGDKCQFAHGADQLRPMPRHPKYKTERCKTFWTVGSCPYANRCRFLHGEPGVSFSAPNSPISGGKILSDKFMGGATPSTPQKLGGISQFQHQANINALLSGDPSGMKSGEGNSIQYFFSSSTATSSLVSSTEVKSGEGGSAFSTVANGGVEESLSVPWLPSPSEALDSSIAPLGSLRPLPLATFSTSKANAATDLESSSLFNGSSLYRTKQESLTSGHFSPLLAPSTKLSLGPLSQSLPSSPLLSATNSGSNFLDAFRALRVDSTSLGSPHNEIEIGSGITLGSAFPSSTASSTNDWDSSFNLINNSKGESLTSILGVPSTWR